MRSSAATSPIAPTVSPPQLEICLLQRSISLFVPCAFGQLPTKKSALNTSLSASSKGASCRRNGLMCIGTEHFPKRKKPLCCGFRCPGLLSDVLARLRASLPGDGIAPFLEFDQQYYLPDDILVKSDRVSMAHAVEVRPPFVDHRIVEFAAKLPIDFKIRGTRQKYLLKEVMRSKLPTAIVQREKIGFDIPAHDWFRGPLRAMLMETLASAEAEHSELFDFETIRTYTQLHLNRRINIGYHLWGLMMLFIWMKRWNIQSAPSLYSERQVLTAEL